MSLKWRIYYNAVFGGIGGLLSWYILGLIVNLSKYPIVLRDIISGAIVGVLIGGFIGVVDGIFSKSIFSMIKGFFWGGISGLIGGILGLLLGELILWIIQGGIWGRALGWMFFGLAIGISEGVVNKAPLKASYGGIGGMIGGFVGGFAFESIRTTYGSYGLSQAWGLIILGACIGSLIAFVEDVMKSVWLKIIHGRLEGKEYAIFQKETILGKANQCDFVIPGDDLIAPKHALIKKQGKNHVIHDISSKEEGVYINKERIIDPQVLQDEDRIRLGRTELIFRTKKSSKASQAKDSFSAISVLIVSILLFSLLIFPVHYLHAQNYQSQINQIDKSNFPEISLYLSVTDGSGYPKKDLKEENFKVFEDSKTVEILDFWDAETEQPLHTILVIDQSGSMREGGKADAALQAAMTFISLMKETDQSGIITFENEPHIVQPLTSSIQKLHDAIDTFEVGGGTAFFDASYEALNQLQSIKGQKAIIALTDGMDNQSGVELPTLLKNAEELGIPIFTIGLGKKSAGLKDESGIDEQSLKKIGEKTGGRYFYAPTVDKLKELYSLISTQLQHGYMIKFRSLQPIKDGTRRLVSVDVKFEDYTGKAKRDYYVPGVIVPQSSPLLLIVLLIPLLLLLFVPSILKKVSKKNKRSKAQKIVKKEKEELPKADQSGQVQPEVAQPIQPVKPGPKLAQVEKLKLVAQGHRFSASPFVFQKDVIKIGRSLENDLIINHASVSNSHAEIKIEKGMYIVEDLQSQNGTFVSFKGDMTQERRITRNAIKKGSIVRFGDVSYLIEAP